MLLLLLLLLLLLSFYITCRYVCRAEALQAADQSQQEIEDEVAAEVAAQGQQRRRQRSAHGGAVRGARAAADTWRHDSRFVPTAAELGEAPYRWHQQLGLFYQAAGFEDDDNGEPVSAQLKLSSLHAYQRAMGAGSELAKCAVCGDHDVVTAAGDPGDRAFGVQLFNVAAGA